MFFFFDFSCFLFLLLPAIKCDFFLLLHWKYEIVVGLFGTQIMKQKKMKEGSYFLIEK
jgi:hypothetical protein